MTIDNPYNTWLSFKIKYFCGLQGDNFNLNGNLAFFADIIELWQLCHDVKRVVVPNHFSNHTDDIVEVKCLHTRILC